MNREFQRLRHLRRWRRSHVDEIADLHRLSRQVDFGRELVAFEGHKIETERQVGRRFFVDVEHDSFSCGVERLRGGGDVVVSASEADFVVVGESQTASKCAADHQRVRNGEFFVDELNFSRAVGKPS